MIICVAIPILCINLRVELYAQNRKVKNLYIKNIHDFYCFVMPVK
jgi:hypothetical protein